MFVFLLKQKKNVYSDYCVAFQRSGIPTPVTPCSEGVPFRKRVRKPISSVSPANLAHAPYELNT